MPNRILSLLTFLALAVTVQAQSLTVPDFNHITVRLPGATNALACGRYVYNGGNGLISPGNSMGWTNLSRTWTNRNGSDLVVKYQPTGEAHPGGNSVWSIHPIGNTTAVYALAPTPPTYYGTNFGGPWLDGNRHAYADSSIAWVIGMNTAPVTSGGWDVNPNGAATTPNTPRYTGTFIDQATSQALTPSGAVQPALDSAMQSDTNAAWFCSNLSLSNSVQRTAMFGFVSELLKAGLLSDLADGVILRSNYNAGTAAIKSLKGNSAVTVSSLTYDASGAALFNNSFAVFTNLLVGATNTQVYTCYITNANDLANPVGSIGGLWNGSLSDGVWFKAIAWFAAAQRQSSVDNPITENYWGKTILPGFSGIPILNGYASRMGIQLNAAFSCSNGVGGNLTKLALNGLSFPNVQLTKQAVGPFTQMFIGGNPVTETTITLPFYGTIKQVLIFNRFLSQADLNAVEKALRWFEPATENLVILGDSTMLHEATSANLARTDHNGGISAKLAASALYAGNPCVYHEGISGAFSEALLLGTPGVFFTNELVLRSPGGPVKKTTYVMGYGYNDWMGATTADQYETNITRLANAINGSGGSLTLLTTRPATTNAASYPNPWWSAAREAVRQSANTWLRSHPELAVRIVDADLLFTTNEISNTNLIGGLSIDGLHLSDAGNQRIVNEILNPTARAYDSAGNVVAAMNLLGFSGLGTGLTNTFNCQSTNYTKANFVPVDGQMKIVASNGFWYSVSRWKTNMLFDGN